MHTKIPSDYAELFSAHGPVLFVDEAQKIPFAWGWLPLMQLDEPVLAAVDKYGSWVGPVLVNYYATVAEMETIAGEAKCVVLDENGDFKFALYGSNVITDSRYDPRSERNMLTLTQEEFDRVETSFEE